jgi:hypothetical protein
MSLAGSGQPAASAMLSIGRLTPLAAALAGSTVRGLHSMKTGSPPVWK